MYKYIRLRDLREDMDLTQANVANLLNVHLTQYRRWENGKTEVPFHIVIQLANFYNISIDYMAGITNEPLPQPKHSKYFVNCNSII